MAYSTWDVNGRSIELDHGWWSGKATLRVDGETVFVRPSPLLFFDMGFAHHFEVDEVAYTVRVVCQIYTFRHELLMGEEAERQRDTNSLPLEFPLHQVLLVTGILALFLICIAITVVAMLVRL